MASVIPILAPFLPISCLCARVSHFDNRMFRSWLLWQLMTMGVTFNNGPDGSSRSLQVDSSYQNRTKVLQNYKSRHNKSNPDKLKLVNYNRKYAYQKFLNAKFW